MNSVLYSTEAPGIKKIILNRPEKRNALSHALIDQFQIALKEAAREARLLLIAGAGSNFCSGLDLSELSFESLQKVAALYLDILHCPVPVITWAHGATAAGGVGIMAASDFSYADPDASFILPELVKGIAPALVFELLKDQVAMRPLCKLAYSCDAMSVAEAHEIGFLSGVGKENLDQKIDSLLKVDLKAFAAFKAHVQSQRKMEGRFQQALELQRSLMK